MLVNVTDNRRRKPISITRLIKTGAIDEHKNTPIVGHITLYIYLLMGSSSCRLQNHNRKPVDNTTATIDTINGVAIEYPKRRKT